MQLSITEQSFLFKESLSKNDVQKEVHFIVKRTPFVVKLALSPGSTQTFTNTPLDCTLFYDSTPLKEVEAPNTKPLEWVVRPSSCGRFATVDYRINVLTTQHQNNLFVIRIRLTKNGQSVEVLTKPIKSVSKPEQVRRRVSQQQVEDPQIDMKATLASCSSKKRARSEELLEALATIQAHQAHHSDMLHLLVTSQNIAGPRPLPSVSPQQSTPMELDVCLDNLATSYSQEALQERPKKLRKMVHLMSTQQKSLIQEIAKLIADDAPFSSQQDPDWFQPEMIPSIHHSSDHCADFATDETSQSLNNFQQWLQ